MGSPICQAGVVTRRTTTGRRAESTSSTRGRDETRRRILAATIDLFGQRGYARTTIAAIAHEVGVTDAAVLYHFRSKSELFVAVVDAFADTNAETFRAMVEPGGAAALERIAGWGAVMEERPDLLALQITLSAEAILPGAELHTYWASRQEALTDLIADLFRQGVDRGDLRPDTDAAAEARALLAHLDGLRLQWFYSERSLSIDAGFRIYVHHVLGRLRVRSRPTDV